MGTFGPFNMASQDELLSQDPEGSVGLTVPPHQTTARWKDEMPSEIPWEAKGLVHKVVAGSVLIEIVLMILKIVLVVCVTNEPFEVDAANYIVAICRNVYLWYSIPRIPKHLEWPDHFAPARLLREAFFGPSSVLLLELSVAAAIAISLEVVALVHGGSGKVASIWLYTMQSLNFVVLFALVLLMGQGWDHLADKCAWQQLLQVAFLIYDIVLHVIIMTKPDIDHDFRDFRLASLASPIALRLICYRFFQFKKDEPTFSFVNPAHCKLKLH